MSKLILQNIAKEINFNTLPATWQDFDLVKFSKEKTLYNFQQDALKNALVILWKYYNNILDFNEKEKLEVNETRKGKLYELYKTDFNFPEKGPDYDLTEKEGKKSEKLLKDYYQVNDRIVSFQNFINQMGFWMATGSGKTLVIVKLIEILAKLIKRKEIPENDILFLTYREDLIEQFKNFVREFNTSQSEFCINLKSLKDYDSVKRDTIFLFREKEVIVFYYRSDLISDKQKEKLIDFKKYENNGKWYVLLDEAHKGGKDKEESKRQIIYSILSRNGFLFNFSATFVDPKDFLTTVFNFNLKEFIEEGYGKNIYLSQEEIKAFKEGENFTKVEQKRIILKSLILLSYIKKFVEKVRKVKSGLYHNPLLLTLVNSVNVEDADLKVFFEGLEDIGHGEIDNKIFELAKKELCEILKRDNKIYFPEGKELLIDEEILSKITFEDILKDVFNSKSPGNIEVLVIPGNKQEMIFKLRTSEKPFALIKIGDISKWIKEKLEGYEIIESFDNESVFKRINSDDSDINILMGSRSFYEGWDSNRPNIILFINIGVGPDVKKFVLQSTGRGVRIEPIKNEKRKLEYLSSEKRLELNTIKNLVLPIETLFIFGTNSNVLKEVINTFEEVSNKEEVLLKDKFTVDKDYKKLPLFVPVYEKSNQILAERDLFPKFIISEEDFNFVKNYYQYFDDKKILLIKYEIEPQLLKLIGKSFKQPDHYYNIDKTLISILDPELIFSRIINHFSTIPEELKKFKKINEENYIVHFKNIKFNKEKKENLEEFLKCLEKVKSYKEKENKLKRITIDFENKKITNQEFLKKIEDISREYLPEENFNGVKIKYVSNHYYYPLILADSNYKDNYLKHIISEESEVRFVKNLDEFIKNNDNLLKEKFDWWLFSKLDENIDEVYIPWYDPKTNKIEHFKPDFIFWAKEKKSNNYYIIFVDPKSTEFNEIYQKISGFINTFNKKSYFQNKYNIFVKLFMIVKDISFIDKKHRAYCSENFEQILKVLFNNKNKN